MEYLSADLGCNFLSLDLPTLEDLGREFRDQATRKPNQEAVKEDSREVDVQATAEVEATRSCDAADHMLEETEKETQISPEDTSAPVSREGHGEDLDESDEMSDWLKDIKLCAFDVSDDMTEATPLDEFTGCDSSTDEEEETPSYDEEFCMAKFYFGTAKPEGNHSTTQQRERNKMALDTVFDAFSAAENNNDGIPTNMSSSLIIFVRDAVRICGLDKGRRLLSRLRDRVIERRKSNMPTLVILLCIGKHSSLSFSANWETTVRKRSSATECLTLPVKNIDKDQLKQWEARYNGQLEKRNARCISELNIRKLKLALKELYPHLVSDELVGADVAWNCKGLGKVGSVLSSEVLPEEAVKDLVRTIGGRAWGKPAILLEDVVTVLNRKESIKDHGKEEDSSTGASKNDDPRLADLNEYEETLANHVIKPGQSPTTYDDIIMDPAAKSTIRLLLSLSKLAPTASSSYILEQLKISGILFYGPPGTGKTHLCRAIANDSGHSLIALSAAELNTKWVGETEKLIQAMFSLARKLYPSIIFLDEVDSLFYRRACDDKSWERTAINQYLTELDGLASNNSDNKVPLVIVASNRPQDLDEAFLRRLPHKVYFHLPSREERKQILSLFLAKEDLDSDVSIRVLAKRTKAFSGSDLKNMCRLAALAWASEAVLKDAGLAQKQVKLAMRHFDCALERTGPSTSPELLEGLINFSERFRA